MDLVTSVQQCERRTITDTHRLDAAEGGSQVAHVQPGPGGAFIVWSLGDRAVVHKTRLCLFNGRSERIASHIALGV